MRWLAILATLIVLSLWGFFLWLTYSFPQTLAAWEQEGRVLTGWQQSLANLSQLFHNHWYGPVALLVALTFGVACLHVVGSRSRARSR
jgi:hypothetical protein